MVVTGVTAQLYSVERAKRGERDGLQSQNIPRFQSQNIPRLQSQNIPRVSEHSEVADAVQVKYYQQVSK